MLKEATDADVAIVGGGPAGATLATLLAMRGVRVLVADADCRRGPPAEVLPPAAVPVLDSLGLLSELEGCPDLARSCLGVVKRWGAVQERHEYLTDAGGRGWVVDRGSFDEKLKQRARRAGAHWLALTRLQGVARRAPEWCLALNGPNGSHNARARFLVDASGRARAVTRRIGVTIERSSKLTASWPGPRPLMLEAGASWLHVSAADAGWSYTLTDPRNRACTVALSFGARAGARGAQHVSACSQLLSSCFGDGWAAVGDAAAAFDPITSQGLTNALASARALASAVEAALQTPRAAEASLRLYDDAMTRTFRHAEKGAREVYRTALRSFGGAFWEHLSASAPRCS
jgi:flavin-dependent dehydrogenase